MRIESAGVDDQPLVEFRACELPGLSFSLKCLGCPRASPFLERPAFVHFKGNVPNIGHFAPKDGATGDVSASGEPRSLLKPGNTLARRLSVPVSLIGDVENNAACRGYLI